MDPKVGQSRVSPGVVLKDGTNARSAIPADTKSPAQVWMSIPSELVNSIVKTSFQLHFLCERLPSSGF